MHNFILLPNMELFKAFLYKNLPENDFYLVILESTLVNTHGNQPNGKPMCPSQPFLPPFVLKPVCKTDRLIF